MESYPGGKGYTCCGKKARTIKIKIENTAALATDSRTILKIRRRLDNLFDIKDYKLFRLWAIRTDEDIANTEPLAGFRMKYY